MEERTAANRPQTEIHYSKTRIAGMALYWTWVFLMFSSIQPYAFLDEKRSALYLGLLISLLSSAVMLTFLAMESKGPDGLRDNKPVLYGSVLAMTLGTLVTPFCSTASATGMLILGIGAVMTGSGSGALLVAWAQGQAPLGGRATLCELSLAFLTAFVFSLILALCPSVLAIIACAAIPGASLWLLLRVPVPQFRPKGSSASEASDASAEAGQMGVPKEEGAFPPVKLSRETKCLFAKGLAGAALIGFLQGFFDVFTGFSTFNADDSFGIFLFVAGVAGFALLAATVWKFPRDSIFLAYRITMLLLCLGFLAVPFLNGTTLGISSVIFAGYNCFCVVLLSVGADISRSFRINRSRCVAIAFAVLYAGEALGEASSHGLQSLITGVPNLGLITLVAVSLLFVSNLFLFTEVDLIKIGIGEVDLTVTNPRTLRAGASQPPSDSDAHDTPGQDLANCTAPGQTAPSHFDPAAALAEQYHLSPRESEVLPLLLEGRTISRIQEMLFISQGTVSTHIRHIYQKTGSANRQELIDLSLEIAERASDGNGDLRPGEGRGANNKVS